MAQAAGYGRSAALRGRQSPHHHLSHTNLDTAAALAILDDIDGLLARSDLLLDRASWRLHWGHVQKAREDAEEALALFDTDRRQFRRQELLAILSAAKEKTS